MKLNLKWLNPKHLIEKIWEDEFKISLFVLAVAFLVVNIPTILSGRYLQREFLESMLANANSMIMDILIILVLTTYLIRKSEIRREIQRLKDEIDDFRGWESEEASHRIKGIVMRLGKLGVSDLDLSSCFLQKANLNKINLSGAILDDACLRWASMSGAILNNARLPNVDLRSAHLSNIAMKCAYLRGADLSGASLRYAEVQGSRLRWANLLGADLSKSNFAGANLSAADLQEANLNFAIFSSTCLSAANLERANLNGTDLSTSDLSGSNFSMAYLCKTNFRGANLQQVKNISEAKNIESADFTDAIMDDETREYLSKINETVKPPEKTHK